MEKSHAPSGHPVDEAATVKSYADALIQTMREPFLVLNSSLKAVYFNKPFEKRFQLKKNKIIGTSISKMGELRFSDSEFLRLLRQVPKTGKGFEAYELRLKCGHRGNCIFRINAHGLHLPKDALKNISKSAVKYDGSKFILLGFEDISEKKIFSEQFSITESRFRKLFESANVGILVLDALSGEVLDVNAHSVVMFGYPLTEVLGKKVWELEAVKDVKQAKKALKALQNNKIVRIPDMPLKTKDGRTLHVEFASNVYGYNHLKVIQCQLRDITDKLQAQEALRISEERYRRIFDEGVLGMAISDKQLHFIKVNRRLCRMLGYSEKEMKRLTFKDISHPASVSKDIRSIQMMLDGKKASYRTVKRYIRKDGDTIWANTHVNFIRGGNGQPDFFQTMVEDITTQKTAEIKLQINAAKYRGLYDSISDGIVRFDLQGKFLECNSSFRKMLGYSMKGLGKLSYYQVTSEKNRTVQDVRLKEQVLKRGYTGIYEENFIKKDGGELSCEARLWLTRDSQGEPESVWGVIRDVTKRKLTEAALQSSEAKYRGLYDSIKDGIEMTDVHGRFVESNKAYQEMLGYTDKELRNMTYHDITPEKWRDVELDILSNQLLKQGFSGEYEKEYIRKDGTIFPVSSRLWMIRDGKGHPIGSWGIVRDITERKKIERLKDDFASLASHQLRTPLTGTKWLVETIQDGQLGPLTQKQKEYVDNIYQTNERMIQLVSDMLDVIHLESGKVAFAREPVSVCEVLDNLIVMLKTAAEKRQVKIVVDCGRLHSPKIIADSKRLQTVLECLVSNAIEYSPTGKGVFVEVVEEPETVSFIVKDSGIGIPKTEQEHIFERFYRASNAKSQKANGTGLGLAIAQMLAKEMGGLITFKSEEGKGSDFILRMPVRGRPKTD